MIYLAGQKSTVSTDRIVAIDAKIPECQMMLRTLLAFLSSPQLFFDFFGDLHHQIDDCLWFQEFFLSKARIASWTLIAK
jgi:hypothetical protein